MIGMVLVTHGRLAEEFVAATEHVVGPQSSMRSVCIDPDDDLEECRTRILAAVAEVEQGRGVLVLTDIFGSTPSNLAISIMETTHIEVIGGINLPMLITLSRVGEETTLEQAVASASAAGRKYISVASEVLKDAAP